MSFFPLPFFPSSFFFFFFSFFLSSSPYLTSLPHSPQKGRKGRKTFHRPALEIGSPSRHGALRSSASRELGVGAPAHDWAGTGTGTRNNKKHLPEREACDISKTSVSRFLFRPLSSLFRHERRENTDFFWPPPVSSCSANLMAEQPACLQRLLPPLPPSSPPSTLLIDRLND